MSVFKSVTFDVEHGSSHILRLPNQSEDVFQLDAGRNQFFSPSEYLKNRWNVERIKCLILSHHDNDHIEDLDDLKKIKPHILSTPTVSRDYLLNHYGGSLPQRLQEFLSFAQEYNVPVPPLDDPAYDWGGVQFAMFSHDEGVHPNLNNLSQAVFVKYQGWTMLFPGDLERPGWLEHLQNDAFVDNLQSVDIFVASHHGRESGYCEEVFEVCKPKLVIVSDKSTSETSVTDKYIKVSQGMNFTKGKRHVLTTRADGAIYLEIDDMGRHKISTQFDYLTK